MEFRDTRPIYMQIADYFCENILLKNWNEDEKIPSVREIAVMLEVNPNTAMRAFNFMQENNIIYNKRGIGYFVSKEGARKAREMKKETFVNEELPVLFRAMELLDLSCKEMEKIYHEKYDNKEKGLN
jgi:DNA-binding transcriptional regulator YhcF (GntR family)